MTERNGLRRETLAIRAGRGGEGAGAPLNVPLEMASSYRAGGEVAYARDAGTASWRAFEEAIGELEGGHAVAFSSGMAVTAAVLERLPLGAHVVYPEVAYITTRGLLRERADGGRLRVTAVDVTDTEATLAACADADLVWIETPTNPLLGIADLVELGREARRLGVRTVVDSTLATPLRQRPLEHDCDLVVHSATKFIGGHSDLLLGVAACRDPEVAQELREVRIQTGATPGGLETWLALRGLRTMALRLDRGESNALHLARRLEQHPEVERVRYPGLADDAGHERARRQMDGFGPMLGFEVSGGAERADAVCEQVELIVAATSLGGVETTIERRAVWSGEELVPESFVRLSVGCEHPEDLWADLAQALEQTSTSR